MVYYSTELYHHGILGQKWGRKNGPPYPLKPSDHSASEKKEGWKKSLKKSASVDTSVSKQYNDDKKLAKGKALVKKVLIGAGAVAATAAVAYVLSSSGSGADKFDNDAYMKSLMLRYSGSTKKKLYSKDNRRIVAHHKFSEVMSVAKGRMPSNAKPGDIYKAFHKGYEYLCEVDEDMAPKIISYHKSNNNGGNR